MKGIYLFECNLKEKKSIIVGKSPFPLYSCNSKFLGDESIVFCDKDANVIIFKQNDLVENDLERIKLSIMACINNSDIIQCSIKRNVSTKAINDKYIGKDGLNQVIFGTSKGYIGVIMTLNEQTYNVLNDLQESILQKYKCPLEYKYQVWKQAKVKKNVFCFVLFFVFFLLEYIMQ